LESGEEQAEAGDGDGVWIDIDAVDGFEGEANSLMRITNGGVLLPFFEEAVKGAEEEVAGPTGRVDQLDHVVAELVNRWVQRVLEDELLDELGGLQQRVGLAGGL
jgi:hypothetical protein